MNALIVMLRKELRQFFGNAFLPKICVMFPLMVMLVIPLVATMDVKHVGVAMVDLDRSTASRRIAQGIEASAYTQLTAMPATYADALALVEKGDVDVIIEVPSGFQASLRSKAPLQLAISANAVNTTKGTLGLQYVQQIAADALAPMMTKAKAQQAPKLPVLNLFNPTLNYRHFMIPGLMIILLIMLCGFLPALNVVGEKEKGTIEQINVSPLSQFTFILGKVMPYWIVGFAVITLAIIVARLAYSLAPAGNLLLIYLASALFIIIMSSLAVTIANFSDKMQQAMLVMFFFVVVFILMSGLLTPIASMPLWAQRLTAFLPPSHYVDILRSVYLRGATLGDLWPRYLALAAFAILLTATAIATYRKQS